MKMHPAIALLSGLLLSAPLAPARDAVPRFKFSGGQTNVFAVEFTVRDENGSVTTSGNLFLAAKDVTTNGATLSCRGNFRLENKRTPPRGPGFFPGFGGGMMHSGMFFPGDSQVTLDALGRELRDGGDYVLDAPLGKFVQSLFGPLPAQAGTEEDTVTVLEDPLYLGPSDNFLNLRQNGQPYGLGYFGMNGMRSGPATLLVKRQTTWQVKTAHPGQIELHRQATMESPLRFNGQPRLAATSESDFVFDAAAGWFSRLDTEADVSAQSETTVRHAKVSFHARLLAGDELAAALAPPPPPAPPRNLAGAELEKFTADLAAEDVEVRRAAIQQLNGTDIESPSTEMLEAIGRFALDSESYVRMTAATFLCKHATTNQVPLLLKLLKDSDWSVRQPAIKALGRLRDLRAAAPLADVAARNGNMYGPDVKAALVNLGAPAETAVLGILNERNAETQREACEILQEIGTGASVEALQKVAAEGDSSASQAANEAIRAIKQRQ